MGKDINLHRDISTYTDGYLRGLLTKATNQGGWLLDKKGKRVILNTEQTVNAEAGAGNDSRGVVSSLNIAGLSAMSPSLNHSNIGGNSGWFAYQKPILTIVQKPPVGTEDLNKYIGLPLEAKYSLSSVTGYTEVSHLFLPDSLTNTMLKSEENEIRELLNGGVIF